MRDQEYRVEVKVKNNLIMEKIEKLGFKNAASFCKSNGITYSSFLNIVNLTLSALNDEGNYRSIVYKLCEALNSIPEELFSSNQMENALKTNKTTLKVNEAEMKFMLESNQEPKMLEDVVLDDQRDKALNEMLDLITQKEKDILQMRFGLGDYERIYTLEEVAIKYQVTRERIRQHESKAMRKLRHPSRCDLLKTILFDNDIDGC